MTTGTKWVNSDGKSLTVVDSDKYGVDFVYDDDKTGRVYWQLKSHFTGNFKPASLGVSLFNPPVAVKG